MIAKKPFIKQGILSLKVIANSREEIEALLLFLEAKYHRTTDSKKYAKIKWDEQENYYYLKIFCHTPANLGEAELMFSVEA